MREQDEQEGTVDAVADGDQAERLLRSPVFTKAVVKLENTYTALWKQANSPEEREQYWQRIQVLKDVVIGLEGVRQDGRIEQKKQENEARKAASAVTVPRMVRGGK